MLFQYCESVLKKKKEKEKRLLQRQAQFYKQIFHKEFFSSTYDSHCQSSKATNRKLPVMTVPRHTGLLQSHLLKWYNFSLYQPRIYFSNWL